VVAAMRLASPGGSGARGPWAAPSWRPTVTITTELSSWRNPPISAAVCLVVPCRLRAGSTATYTCPAEPMSWRSRATSSDPRASLSSAMNTGEDCNSCAVCSGPVDTAADATLPPASTTTDDTPTHHSPDLSDNIT